MALTGALLLLTACAKPPEAPPAVRSVRTQLTSLEPVRLQDVYAGEIRPRYESALGFRVSGKIRERLVNVGENVKSGAILMVLDERDLALSEQASRAAVKAQEARFAVEKADFDRFTKLAAGKFISQAEFERQKTHFEAAKAQLDAAQAEASVTGNQTGYSTLRAESAGTITGIEVEVGQVVAAGQVVVRLARAGDLEVAANVPEHRVHLIKPGMPVEVTLWAAGEQRFRGVVRELASAADPATRTYGVRVSLTAAPASMRQGMTASVIVSSPDAPRLIRVPIAAYVQLAGRAGVWLVDKQASTVAFQPVDAVGFDGNEVLLGPEIKPGERVVTAGASLLHEGQRVRLATVRATDTSKP